MLPFRRAKVLFLGAALLLAGCSAPAPDPTESNASGPATSPSASPSSSAPPADSPAPTGSPADPLEPEPSSPGTGKSEPIDSDSVVARVAIDVSESVPKMAEPDVASTTRVDFSGDLQTGGQFTVLLQPGQALAITVAAPGSVSASASASSSPTNRVSTVAQLDNSVPILVGSEFKLGLAAPQVIDGAAGSNDAAALLTEVRGAGNSLSYLVMLNEDAAPTTVSVTAGKLAASAAVWNQAEGGKSLWVTPSQWGRSGGLTVMEHGWPSVLELVGVTGPEANSDSMRNQFQCHVIGAPNKETWNLEPWRPDVGLLKFMAARCNP